MNTRNIMTSSALLLGFFGILLTFNPNLILDYLSINHDWSTIIIIQILGAFYFAFGMLNWMSRGSIIGGIYNRPIVISNFSHFLIVCIALIKELYILQNPLLGLWFLAIFYLLYAILFGFIFLNNPNNVINNG